jgi:hypothetical protein
MLILSKRVAACRHERIEGQLREIYLVRIKITHYLQMDAFPKEPLGPARGHDKLYRTIAVL